MHVSSTLRGGLTFGNLGVKYRGTTKYGMFAFCQLKYYNSVFFIYERYWKKVLNTGCFLRRHPVESAQTLHVKCARYHLSPHEQKAFTGALGTGVIAHFYSRNFAITIVKKQLSLISGAEHLVAHSLLVLHSGPSLPRLLPHLRLGYQGV